MSLWKCFWQNCFWPLLLLVLLGLAQMFWPGGKWRYIEQDVKSTIMSSLTSNGIDWAQVETNDRGRDVLLSGSAPSEDAKIFAMKIASELSQDKRGNSVARIVEWKGAIVIPEPDPGNLSFSVVNGKIILNGVVSSEKEVLDLVTAANEKYGVDNVTNRLTVQDNIIPLENIKGLVQSLNINDGTLRLSLNKVLKVTGVTDSDEARDSIGQSLLGALGSNYSLDNRLTVKLPEPEPEPEPDLGAICQAKVLELMSVSKIFFATGKSQIKTESYPLLDEISAILNECEESFIEVAGHTDNTGSKQINGPLSQDRAQAVMDYLTTKGIAIYRLSAVGFGSDQPIADNKTRDGRATNRRIEFTVK